MIGKKEIAELAALRSAPHPNSKHWGADGEAMCEAGMGAEVAFARIFGFPIDRAAMTLHPEGDHGVDFTVRVKGRAKPVTIDVKGATKEPWSLLVNVATLRHKTEMFVCMADKPTGFECMGWAWYDEVAKAEKVDFDRGEGGECHRIFPWKLRTLKSLCAYFAENRIEYTVARRK